MIERMNTPIAVVICNWNRREDLIRCLDSLDQQQRVHLRIIVADNASTDGSAEAVVAAYPAVQIVRNAENLGGSGGFNSGMRAALESGNEEFLMILDNDVLLAPDAVRRLADRLEADPTIGVAGARLYRMQQPEILQELGARIDWQRADVSPMYKGVHESSAPDHDLDVDYVPACAMLVRRKALEETGLFDEGCFIYWDDIDWGYRVGRAGWRVIAAHDAKVWHKMGVGEKKSTHPTYYFWRNRLNFFRRWTPAEDRERLFRQLLGEWLQARLTCLFCQRFTTGLSLREALRDAVAGNRGKASAHQFGPAENPAAMVKSLLGESRRLALTGDEELCARVQAGLARHLPEIEVSINSPDAGSTLLFAVCSHVFADPAPSVEHPSIDPYLHVLSAGINRETKVQRFRKIQQSWQEMILPGLIETFSGKTEDGFRHRVDN